MPRYEIYRDENQLQEIIRLIENDLSEPYCIYTYRYFLALWPHLCLVALDDADKIVGVIIAKLELHKSGSMRGYIGMLAVSKTMRGQGIGSALVRQMIDKLKEAGADELVLETELTNTGALSLYQKLGFVRDKRLSRYYLNGVDAFRLKYWFT